MDAAVIADGERAPNWYRRYRFYSAGTVPRGYEDWARRRLSLARWVGIYLVIQVVVCGLVGALAVWSGFIDLKGACLVGLVTVLMAPFSAKQCRNAARRALAPPLTPARQVLREIGEPVPPAL